MGFRSLELTAREADAPDRAETRGKLVEVAGRTGGIDRVLDHRDGEVEVSLRQLEQAEVLAQRRDATQRSRVAREPETLDVRFARGADVALEVGDVPEIRERHRRTSGVALGTREDERLPERLGGRGKVSLLRRKDPDAGERALAQRRVRLAGGGERVLEQPASDAVVRTYPPEVSQRRRCGERIVAASHCEGVPDRRANVRLVGLKPGKPLRLARPGQFRLCRYGKRHEPGEMPMSDALFVGRLSEACRGELANGLEHRDATVCDAHETVVGKSLQHVDGRLADLFRRFETAAVVED